MKTDNFEISQINTKCLSQFAYFIKSGNECAVIDPLRDISQIETLIESSGCTLKYVILTHFHADFVAGHFDLNKKYGTSIYIGSSGTPIPNVKSSFLFNFKMHCMKNNSRIKLGSTYLHFWSTPGHTLESSCILVSENTEQPYNEEDLESYRIKAVFTGDTLFLGDVGRPDLVASGSSDLDQFKLAAMMFDSVQKLAKLPGDVVVYPGHGAGSACGKNISSATSCSIGNQKLKNYAFQIKDKEKFVEELTSNIPPPPDYFFHNVKMNKTKDKATTSEILQRGYQEISLTDMPKHIEDPNTIILDCRSPQEYTESHIPKSYFSPLKSKFAIWAANLISDSPKSIVILCNKDSEKEAITRCSRTGIDNIIGYFSDFEKYKAEGLPVESVSCLNPEDVLAKVNSEDSGFEILDVRNLGEYRKEHIDGAKLVSLNVLKPNLGKISAEKDVFIHCAGGTRSLVAYSLLDSHGFSKIFNVKLGFKGLKEHPFKFVSE